MFIFGIIMVVFGRGPSRASRAVVAFCILGCTSWFGWGGGDVNVHVNLRHTRMLRLGLGGVGGTLTFM